MRYLQVQRDRLAILLTTAADSEHSVEAATHTTSVSKNL